MARPLSDAMSNQFKSVAHEKITVVREIQPDRQIRVAIYTGENPTTPVLVLWNDEILDLSLRLTKALCADFRPME